MRRALFGAVAVFVAVAGRPTGAYAASGDIAAGYSYARITNGSGTNIPGGWFATVGWNVMPMAPMVDVVGDFSGGYKSESGISTKMHSYLFGPRVRWAGPMMPVSVYGQILFGGETDSADCSFCTSQSNFAYAPGGGIDAKINNQWNGRLGVSYRLVHTSGDWGKVFQVIAGVVYNWK
jgi:hypothetical protein